MSQWEPRTTSELATAPAATARLGHYASYGEAFEHGLLVLALGHPFWLIPTRDGHGLFVPTEVEAEARRQMTWYELEKEQTSSERGQKIASATWAGVGPLLWAMVVLLSYWVQQSWPVWTELGRMDAAAVFDGREWWRLGTALFLHADGAHLIANGISGIFIFSAVLSTFGRRTGGAFLILAATAGNLLAGALLYPGVYLSYGASTAVFAALGLLTGRAVAAGSSTEKRARRRILLAPFAAGLALLGLFGAGGGNVDVLAHLTGFLMGLLLGLGSCFFLRGGLGEPETEPAHAAPPVDRK
jgi:rhomboid protease GluP